MNNKKNSTTNKHAEKQAEATIAPSMEMDMLDQNASDEEVKEGEYTEVTKLVVDRISD